MKQNLIKIIKILATTIMLIFLVSCTAEQIRENFSFMNKREQLETKETLQEGTEALKIRFMQETTPSEIKEGSLFDIQFEIQNNGYNKISEGIYKIITEEEYIQIEKNKGNMIIEGKSKYLPEGETKIITARAKAGEIDTNIDKYPINLVMLACYGYKTTATTQVCIDPDLQGLKKNKVCQAEEKTITGGQGAPIAVTNIKPKIELTERGMRPSFEISIENKGEGQAINENYIQQACGAKQITNNEDYDTIELQATLSNIELQCTPEKIKIKKGKETKIYCQQTNPITTTDSYESPLQININYGYISSANGQVQITKGATQ